MAASAQRQHPLHLLAYSLSAWPRRAPRANPGLVHRFVLTGIAANSAIASASERDGICGCFAGHPGKAPIVRDLPWAILQRPGSAQNFPVSGDDIRVLHCGTPYGQRSGAIRGQSISDMRHGFYRGLQWRFLAECLSRFRFMRCPDAAGKPAAWHSHRKGERLHQAIADKAAAGLM